MHQQQQQQDGSERTASADQDRPTQQQQRKAEDVPVSDSPMSDEQERAAKLDKLGARKKRPAEAVTVTPDTVTPDDDHQQSLEAKKAKLVEAVLAQSNDR